MSSAYPKYYKALGENEKINMMSLWDEMVGEYFADDVLIAVKEHISESPYPPKISDIISRVDRRLKKESGSKWGVAYGKDEIARLQQILEKARGL